jgi:hypothetical protein
MPLRISESLLRLACMAKQAPISKNELKKSLVIIASIVAIAILSSLASNYAILVYLPYHNGVLASCRRLLHRIKKSLPMSLLQQSVWNHSTARLLLALWLNQRLKRVTIRMEDTQMSRVQK